MQFAEELANKNGFIGSKPKMVEYARPHWEVSGKHTGTITLHFTSLHYTTLVNIYKFHWKHFLFS